MSAAVAILSSRESPAVLTATLEAVFQATPASTRVDLVVNGNAELADAMAQRASGSGSGHGQRALRVWHVPCGDKAHAWNVYLHDIWADGGHAFFVDGYARPQRHACLRLLEQLSSSAHALGASGVPTSGPSASKLRQEMRAAGGIHGNLFVVRGEVMTELRRRGYRLPLGLYRTDSTLGATLNHALDPARNTWDERRIAIDYEASWDVDRRAWWYWQELRGRWRRRLRQGQGVLENLAVRHHLAMQKRAPELMPRTVAELVAVWAAEAPDELARALRFDPFVRNALINLRRPRDWSVAQEPPELLTAIQVDFHSAVGAAP